MTNNTAIGIALILLAGAHYILLWYSVRAAIKARATFRPLSSRWVTVAYLVGLCGHFTDRVRLRLQPTLIEDAWTSNPTGADVVTIVWFAAVTSLWLMSYFMRGMLERPR